MSIVYVVSVKKEGCHAGPIQKIYNSRKNAESWVRGAEDIYKNMHNVGLIIEEFEVYDSLENSIFESFF